MRHALLTLSAISLLFTACGGHHDTPEPAAPPAPAPVAVEEHHEPVAPPTGVRPLQPGEPATPDLTGTGGGPGANSVAGVTRAARAMFETCWVDAMRAGSAHGEVNGGVTMHVLADGTVSEGHASFEGETPPAFQTCIESKAKEVRFPVTQGEHDFTVPLSFHAG